MLTLPDDTLAWLAKLGGMQVLLLGGFWVLIKKYVDAYVDKKASNRADFEDVPILTRKTEEILQAFRDQSETLAQRNREILERLGQRHELRMVALEKRLAVHQEAYTLWYEMYANRHTKAAAVASSIKAQDWWLKNLS